MATDKPKPRSLEETSLSVRIPDDKHRQLKARCVLAGIPMRSLILAVINEIEEDSKHGKALMKRATDLK